MKNSKTRIKYITILAAIISILSLGIGYSSYNTTSGTSQIVEKVYEIKLSNIHDIKTSNEAILFKQEPIITNNDISFSITSLIPNNNISFKFDIENKGNVKTRIKDIKIKGLEKYDGYLTYRLSNIKKGDILKGETKIKDNEFILEYNKEVSDEYGNPLNINLDNITLTIELKQVKE